MPVDTLAGLNAVQREAVSQTDGPMLIIAGPGSGKTRVIAHRIAHLIADRGVAPWQIIAVTFTNKAAREMRDRVAALLGGAGDQVTLGTFHAVCARILRIDGAAVGLDRGFVIYDDGDQLALVKRALDDLSLDPKRNSPRSAVAAISRAKNDMRSPRAYAAAVGSYFEEVVARVYARYQDLLEESNAVDFDDLLLKTVELLARHPDVL